MNKLAITCLLASGLILSACGTNEAFAEEKTPNVTVNIINSKGADIGTAQLSQIGDKVQILIEAHNLPPGIHGTHFHAVGRCDTPDFKTAEAHLNPKHKQHGFENPKGFHAGDLPNIEVGADGKVRANITTTTVTLEKGKPNSLLRPGGTSLIIHDKADDYITDPTGNSGDRIACGAIKE
ncbi:superoxide dismutase family protein [Paenibacillus sp. MER TA 81-3]|uniref:superoxide dismutase family protein n=1 Tax=Paenibacillus sp. MER TA 81-3 TaxID=2939573 RepID=UPI00203C351E|nr:superoxide dismutase family protein [Paenibacillus sp. MER TA 81-3]MCM3342134.1 superoxide dismutase family protein [Paenibacillus sp. MER TA 81-3]